MHIDSKEQCTKNHAQALALAAHYAHLLYAFTLPPHTDPKVILTVKSQALLELQLFQQQIAHIPLPMGYLPFLDQLASAVLKICDPETADDQ